MEAADSEVVEIRRPGVWVRCSANAEEWVRPLLDEGPTLYAAAGRRRREEPLGPELAGRGAVFLVEGPNDTKWAVRHYLRGGWMAPVLGDRFLPPLTPLGAYRPFQEARASDRLRRRGVATPKVVAAAVYPGPVWYRGDLVTEYVEGYQELVRYLFHVRPGRMGGPVDEALYRVGRLVRKLARVGAYHRDLNAKNILIPDEMDSGPLHVLDLDRCSVRERNGEWSQAGRKMLRRLERSLRKWAETAGPPLPPDAWVALREGYADPVPITDGGAAPPDTP